MYLLDSLHALLTALEKQAVWGRVDKLPSFLGKRLIDGFLKNLAAFPAQFCGHVLAGFVEPANPENLVDSKKLCPCFASGNADNELKRTANSLDYFDYSLELIFFLKVR